MSHFVCAMCGTRRTRLAVLLLPFLLPRGARASVEGTRSAPTLIVNADRSGCVLGLYKQNCFKVAVIAEMPPKVVSRAMKCLSPLDPGAMGIIDQSANTSNHILFEQILVSAAIMIFV